MTSPFNYRGYDAVRINRELWRIRKGNDMVGEARRGMDGKWYAELGGDPSAMAAIQRVIIATEAIEEFTDAVNG
jgi:hypothetical protein